jgi:hypothetical protein
MPASLRTGTMTTRSRRSTVTTQPMRAERAARASTVRLRTARRSVKASREKRATSVPQRWPKMIGLATSR